MQKVACFTLLVAVIHCVKLNDHIPCEKEFSLGVNDVLFTWESTHGEGTYDSKPLCLDGKNNIHKRKCYAGQWSPKNLPFCYNFVCPKHFIARNSSCLYVTEPRTYDNGCPNARSITTASTITSYYHWIPVKRKIKFGPFEHDVPGNTYGKFVQQTGEYDCMIGQDNGFLVSVNCSSLYSHACYYTENNFLRNINPDNITPMEVLLKFDRHNSKLFLMVYSPELLLKVKDDDDDDDDCNDDEGNEAVYCFTDAEGNLKSEVDIEKVYDSRKSSLNNRIKNLAVYKLELDDEPSQYWCEVFNITSNKPLRSNIVIGHKARNGNEYSLRVVMKNLCLFTNCTKAFAKYKVLEEFCKEIHVRCRLMVIFSMSNFESDLLVHVSSRERRNVIGEYYKIRRKFERFNATHMNVVYFKSSEVCLPDTTTVGANKLSWQLTQLGSMATPKELCLNQKRLLVTRNCEGDFLHGAEWSTLNDSCLDNIQVSVTTEFLYNTVSENISSDSLKNLSLATSTSQDLSAVDLSLIADGLYQISMQNVSSNLTHVFTKSVSNIINANDTMLKSAQLFLNSTDKILDATEIFFGKTEHALNNLTVIKESNFIIHITKPFKNNVTGVALYGTSSSSFLEYNVVNMYNYNTFDNLKLQGLDLAVYIPNELLQALSSNLTESAKENITVITTIFFNDSLFNQNETKMSALGKIVGVTIPGFGAYLETPLPLLFKSSQRRTKADCAYWNYGQDSINKKGQWSMLGENYLESYDNNSLVNCAFSHLTHFALLILSERVTATEEVGGVITTVNAHSKHEMDLTIITAVGCCLSFIGILGIFLTAMLFKKWRDKIGTKILLQLSVTIVIEIITTQLAGMENWLHHRTICTIIGVVLQYIVLTQFCWMLVIAYLQYLRFVKVLRAMPPRLLLKSMIIGWLVPLMPVVLTASISPGSYSAGIQKFCYPKGMALYVGLIAPAVVTVVANILIFSVIMYNISHSKAKQYSKSKKIHKFQMYLAVLLFFMLGLHWVFGIMAEIFAKTWFEMAFIYLFCLTATLQGFVLFIFYVIFDKDTRLLWVSYVKSYF